MDSRFNLEEVSPNLQESSDDLAKRRYKAETSFFRWWSWYVVVILAFSIWAKNYCWQTPADNTTAAPQERDC